MKEILVVYGHPYPNRSRAGRALLAAVDDLPNLRVHALYSLYPDFAIDVEREQELVLASDVLVWQCPFYWYGMPALMHLWVEKVLAHGWAYGKGGDKVRGKTVQWVTTTGAPESEYTARGIHGHEFSRFVPAISQTAIFCGMRFADPIVVFGSHRLSEKELLHQGTRYRNRLIELGSEPKGDARG